jgi:hypothetical protein
MPSPLELNLSFSGFCLYQLGAKRLTKCDLQPTLMKKEEANDNF